MRNCCCIQSVGGVRMMSDTQTMRRTKECEGDGSRTSERSTGLVRFQKERRGKCNRGQKGSATNGGSILMETQYRGL